MAALLRQGERRIGGSVFQRIQAALTSPAAAEERRRLVPRRMYSTHEAATMTALLRQGARKIGASVLQRTQAVVTSPAVAGKRCRLVPRRMYSTKETVFPPPSVDSPVIKALMNKKVLTQGEVKLISLAEIKRLDEIGSMLRGQVSAPAAVKKVSAPMGVKKRCDLRTPTSAYAIVFGFVICLLVLWKATQTKE